MVSQNSKLKCQSHNSKGKIDLRDRCYQYSIRVIRLAAKFPKERIYWVISDQLLRSATSIGANIVEAKSASSKRDFARFYEIALKSSNETKYWLGLLRDALDVRDAEVEYLLGEAEQLSKIVAASLITMKKRNQF